MRLRRDAKWTLWQPFRYTVKGERGKQDLIFMTTCKISDNIFGDPKVISDKWDEDVGGGADHNKENFPN